MTPLKVYVADIALIPAAQLIVEITKKMVGGVDIPVEVEPAVFPHPANFAWVNGMVSSGQLQPVWSSGTITNSGGTYTVPSKACNTPLTTPFASSSSIWINSGTTTTTTYTPTPANYTINIGTGGSPLTPDQVPANEAFEQMLLASIKQLNEAYNLGRLHGYVQGKEEGALAEHKAAQDAMDTEILETERTYDGGSDGCAKVAWLSTV